MFDRIKEMNAKQTNSEKLLRLLFRIRGTLYFIYYKVTRFFDFNKNERREREAEERELEWERENDIALERAFQDLADSMIDLDKK
ncbi:MAG: hypothetical protein IPM96_21710 [Ignavibacteria bacterium]|nr:hypothetical protein [Ignavibacteria bacterium]